MNLESQIWSLLLDFEDKDLDCNLVGKILQSYITLRQGVVFIRLYTQSFTFFIPKCRLSTSEMDFVLHINDSIKWSSSLLLCFEHSSSLGSCFICFQNTLTTYAHYILYVVIRCILYWKLRTATTILYALNLIIRTFGCSMETSVCCTCIWIRWCWWYGAPIHVTPYLFLRNAHCERASCSIDMLRALCVCVRARSRVNWF